MGNAAMLALGLAATRGLPIDAAGWRNFPRIVAISCVTAGLAFALSRLFAGALAPESSFLTRASALAAICLAGVAAHLALMLATGLARREGLSAALGRRQARL